MDFILVAAPPGRGTAGPPFEVFDENSEKRMARTATISRKTAETDIQLTLELDGSGVAQVGTGVGFFDHMLTLLAKHALFDLSVTAKGDLDVDFHHTVEDVGICLGKALAQALGDKRGIVRYGSKTLPMEETLVTAAVDLGGRMWFVSRVAFTAEKIGDFDTELVETFWQAVAANALMNLHHVLHYGSNSHHIAEAVFKSTARALREAVAVDPRQTGVPSSKGTLS
jgi:imidazoleglycerol-phosphate dehydratase